MSELRWKWCRVDKVGLWAFGGLNKEASPTFMSAFHALNVPIYDDAERWRCYLGPIPTILPPEPELRLPEGWTYSLSIIPCGERAGWWKAVVRNGEHKTQVDIGDPDKATVFRAAQAAVDAMDQ